MAPKYVASSYTLFDKELDIKWCLGYNDTDIKEMDHTLLKDVTVYPTVHLIKGYKLSGIGGIAKDKTIQSYLLIGDPLCWSMWTLPYKIRFHNPKALIYFWSHGWYGKESTIKAFVKKLFFKVADGVFLYGNYAKNLMIQEGFDEKKLFTIHNCLDHDTQVSLRNTIEQTTFYEEHFLNSHPVLIFIGRLTPVKRLDLLIEAVAMLKKQNLIFNIVFVGDGTERSSLESLIKKEQLEDTTWFYGACYDEKTNAELLFNADLCVAPGNVGLTAMHSMVFGTPVLTHNDFRWQMPEFEAIIEGETGCFFEKDNVWSLCDAIKRWFEMKMDKREGVREACYKEIDENWTPEFELNVLKKNLNKKNGNITRC